MYTCTHAAKGQGLGDKMADKGLDAEQDEHARNDLGDGTVAGCGPTMTGSQGWSGIPQVVNNVASADPTSEAAGTRGHAPSLTCRERLVYHLELRRKLVAS